MKNSFLILSALILVFSSCESKKEGSEVVTSESVTATVVNLNPAQFQEKSANGIVIDVRTAEEVAEGKIPGSLAMDYFLPDFLTKVKELPKDKEIYLYCAVGGRSKEAAEMLIQEGYTKVYHLSGGIQAWSNAGLPITQE